MMSMTWNGTAAGAIAREEMKVQGVSVSALAAEMGRSVSTVRRRLAGKGVWMLCETIATARVIGMRPSEFLERVDAASAAKA